MSAAFRVYDIEAIHKAVKRQDVVPAIRRAFVDHWRGEVVSALPAQLLFENPPGDCHIKSGYFRGSKVLR